MLRAYHNVSVNVAIFCIAMMVVGGIIAVVASKAIGAIFIIPGFIGTIVAGVVSGVLGFIRVFT